MNLPISNIPICDMNGENLDNRAHTLCVSIESGMVKPFDNPINELIIWDVIIDKAVIGMKETPFEKVLDRKSVV